MQFLTVSSPQAMCCLFPGPKAGQRAAMFKAAATMDPRAMWEYLQLKESNKKAYKAALGAHHVGRRGLRVGILSRHTQQFMAGGVLKDQAFQRQCYGGRLGPQALQLMMLMMFYLIYA